MGADSFGKEIFPKPGAELAWLLNHDFFEKMKIIEEWTRANPHASMESVGTKSKEVLKLVFDVTYGVAMTNDPRYIHNRIARIDFTDNAFPENAEIMKLFKKLYFSGGIGNLDGLVALIEKGKEIANSALAQLKPIVDKLSETAD